MSERIIYTPFILNDSFLSLIIEHAPLAVYTVDASGCIDFFNKKFVEISGLEAEKLKGLNVLELSSYKENGLDAYIRKILVDGESPEIEVEHINSFSKKKTYRHYIGAPLKEKTGVIHHALLMAEDVTERKNLEIQLQERAKELEAVVAVRTKELQETVKKLEERTTILESMNKNMINRELKMTELKKEIDTLKNPKIA